jgi:lipopolysaccharide heptosyltransferase I
LDKLLIVRLGALGDVVHAIPVAAALRRAHPSARIDWLVSAKHRAILDLVPVIDRRLAINDRPSGGARAPGGARFVATVRELRQARYDVVLDLQGLIKSAIIARSSGTPRVVGFAAPYLREPLARLFYTDVHDPGGEGIYAPSETRHVVQINLGLLEPLGIRTTSAEFPIDGASSATAEAVIERAGGRYVLLNPGAAWPNKRWPPARFGALAATLRERVDLKSIVLWGPSERELADQVVDGAGGAALRAPATTIADVVALARGADVMISGDTGPAHIGAAVGTPMVGIYGPTRPERNGPWLPEDVTLSRASECRCHHLRRCKLERMCLLDIEVDEVVRAVERRLAAGRARV